MPHFKCVPCNMRLHGPADPVGVLCPGCGSLLEPVGELSELVGFRSIKSRDGGAPGTHERLADRVDDLLARRDALLAQARLDAARWLDDGGSFSPQAVAEAVALPTPEENP